jgi:threonine dehydratase
VQPALVSLADVERAARNIDGVAVRTPLLTAPWGGDLHLKPENLQPIGAFKLRGAYHAVASLPPEVRRTGVVTHSSGNHAQALAFAARAFGIPCVIVMPDVAPRVKVEATAALGAEIVMAPPPERNTTSAAIAAERNMTLIPPFDHHDVIAGQGTIGLEIVADLPEVASVLVPIGGGGLASGVAVAVKALRPGTAVIGVEPELAGDAAESVAAGELRQWPLELTYRTIADGLRTALSERTLAHLRRYLDAVVTVTEAEIEDAMARIALLGRLVAEPSGAVSVAGYLKHRHALPGGPAVAVVSGGNVEPATLARVLASAQPQPASPSRSSTQAIRNASSFQAS